MNRGKLEEIKGKLSDYDYYLRDILTDVIDALLEEDKFAAVKEQRTLLEIKIHRLETIINSLLKVKKELDIFDELMDGL